MQYVKKHRKSIFAGFLVALFLFLLIQNNLLSRQLRELNNRIKKYSFERVADIDLYKIEKDGAVCLIAKTEKGVGISCNMKPVPAKIYKMGD